MLVDAWLPRAAHADPARLAAGGLSYAALLGAARAGAAQLAASGVRPGDRVALTAAGAQALCVALHCCLLHGAIAVPIDPRLGAAEAARQADGAAATIDDAQVADWLGPTAQAADALAAAAHGARGERHDLDAVAIEVHTSGTSAAPKRVALTYGNWLWSALGSAAALGADPDERWLCCLPLSHVGGLSILMRSAILGTTALLHHGFSTERVLGELRDPDGPTLVSLVPTTLARLLDAGLQRPAALRWALLGGAAITPALLERAAAAGVPVAPTYGMTEACSQVATFGRPLFCTRVRTSQRGELEVSGPTVAPASGPWLATGDLGTVSDAGLVTVTGRAADTIITGGENVAPQEVEDALCAHPAVAEAGVRGRPDPEWGEALVAHVVLRSGAQVSADELRAFLATRLAGFKVPKQIAFERALPRTASGKLARSRLGTEH